MLRKEVESNNVYFEKKRDKLRETSRNKMAS